MALRRITDAATEPVTLSEAKAHLRVTATDDDALITALIAAARTTCENEIRRSLITQTWQKTLDQFPDAIELPYPPIIGITSVTYIDAISGTETTLSAPSYTLDAKSEPGWLVPAYGYTWPTPQDVINAVTVTYTAGYGAAADVPEAIKAWIKLHVGHWYANREASVVGATAVQLPFAAGLLDPFRIY